ncbi:MAG: hypothetical protein AAF721_00150 [Myxococcota bacterium]
MGDTSKLRRGTLVGFALGLAACGGPDGGRSGQPSGPGLASAGETGAADGDDDGGATGSAGDDAADDAADDSGGGGSVFDVGSPDTGELPEDEVGCQAVDFLFVIDNSASMENEQDALVSVFPQFMAEVEAALDVGGDYQVLVADTDAWGRCDSQTLQGMDPGSDLCNNYIGSTAFDNCDGERGAGVVHPAGDFASNAACAPFGGNRYIVPGEPDLGGTFACMATVGVAGHPSERPMDGMVAALAPQINAAGGCNDGFLRADALLVIVFISDDPHYEDNGEPSDWYNAVVASKNGDPESVVVMGMTPDWPGCRDGDGDTVGVHWSEFVGLWGDNGLHGNVCGDAMEYLAFFQMAVAQIDQACSEFMPPG